MKIKQSFLIISSLLLLLSPLSSCTVSGGQIQFDQSQYIFDIYAEEKITFASFNENNTYIWSSSNQDIATVDNNGHVSCQGKVGETTITVTSGNISGSVLVLCKNQMINPSISAEDFTGFIGYGVSPNVEVRYSDNYYPLSDYSLKSADTNIATIDGKKVVGVSEGETIISINGNWKGKKLREKKISVSISNGSTLFLEQDVFDVYSVDDTATVKENYVDIVGDVYIGGQKLESSLTVTLDNNPYVTANNNRVEIVNNYTGEEPFIVNGYVSPVINTSIKKDIQIRVNPNNILKELATEIEPTYKAKVELNYADFEGHNNCYKYFIPDEKINQNTTNKAWSSWDTRVEFYETTTKNGVHAYNYMMEQGFSLLSFDIYYTGNKGVYIGAYGSSANEYYYNDVQVNRSDILLVNSSGVATNTLTNDQWYTVYISLSELILKSMTQGQVSAALFVAPCFVNDTCYLDNVRYYYDFSPLNNITIGYDDDVRELVVDDANPNKATTNNEFVVFSPLYVDHTLNTTTGLYKYDSSKAKAMDRESRSKITPYNLDSGIAIRSGYKYFAFSYVYHSGSPILYYFNNYTNSTKNIILNGKTGTNEIIQYYKDGLPVSSFNADEKVTVVVRIDTKSTNPLYFTSSVDTCFETGNYVYFKDTSYINEYSYNAPLQVFVDNVDNAFVGDVINLKNYINVLYKGQAINDFSLGSLVLSSRIATYTNGKIIINDVGVLNVSFNLAKDNFVVKENITINVKEDTYIELANDSIQLYAGDKDYFKKSEYINALVIKNKEAAPINEVKYELVNNNGVLSISSNKITALKEGDEQVRVSIVNDGTTYEKFVNVNVFDKYRKGSFSFASLDASSPATYKSVNQTVYGVSNPYLYSASTASWNNKLDISETIHTDITRSKSNIIDGHIAYITYKFLLSTNTTLRAANINEIGSHANIKLHANEALDLSNNSNIKVLDDEGNVPTTLLANTWYELRVDFSLFKTQYKSGYTCHELTYLKGNMYISDIRYYHESII